MSCPNVSINGVTKLITINSGVTSLDVQVDLYSYWKEWVILNDNSKYLPAFRAVGGDEISSGFYLTASYFLINGWRVKPPEEDSYINVLGNLYVDGSNTSPFISPDGNFNVVFNLNTSNVVTTVATGSGVTAQDKIDILNGVQALLQTVNVGIQTDDKNDIIDGVSNSGIGISEVDKDDIADKVKVALEPDMKKMLGLLHQNFRLTDQQYNADGNLVTANVFLYGNSSDCIDAVNPIGSYTMVANYNSQKKLIDYKMWNN